MSSDVGDTGKRVPQAIDGHQQDERLRRPPTARQMGLITVTVLKARSWAGAATLESCGKEIPLESTIKRIVKGSRRIPETGPGGGDEGQTVESKRRRHLKDPGDNHH